MKHNCIYCAAVRAAVRVCMASLRFLSESLLSLWELWRSKVATRFYLAYVVTFPIVTLAFILLELWETVSEVAALVKDGCMSPKEFREMKLRNR